MFPKTTLSPTIDKFHLRKDGPRYLECRIKILAALLAIQLAALPVSATLLAYEPFEDLADGNLVGQGSGFGWGDWNGVLPDDTWKLHSNGTSGLVTVESGALGYTDALGNILNVAGAQRARAAGTAGSAAIAFRPVAGTGMPSIYDSQYGTLRYQVQFLGADAYYISFIAKREGQTDAEWTAGADPDNNPYSRNSHLTIVSRPTTELQYYAPGEIAVIGNTFAVADENDWNFSGGTTQLGTGVEFGGSDQRFIVIKVELDGPGDLIEMWIDPILESESAANANNLAKVMAQFTDEGRKHIAQGAIGLAAGGGDGNRAPGDIIFDEIRIGTTWESVTPYSVPGRDFWAHYPIISEDGFVDTGDWLGIIKITEFDYIWSFEWGKWLYCPEDLVDERGGWTYVPRPGD